MVIRQGEIWWVDFGQAKGSKARGVYPGVVVQTNGINDSKINTVVVVCLITGTLKRAGARGNVFLFKGEGGLEKDSMVNVSLITHVNKTDLIEKMGTLHPDRLREITAGIRVVIEGRRAGRP